MATIGPFKNEFAFLSNFYQIPGGMAFDGLWVPTSEHAYQMMKAVTEEDKIKVSEASTPGKAKKIGQQIECRDDWDNIKIDIMRKVLESKFRNPILREMLKLTNGYLLVEFNWHQDMFWGVKLQDMKGLNWLGKLLMELRDKKEIK